MEYPKKELIKEITDLFEDYEETYVPGEWEAFSKSNRKRYPFFSTWMKVAAVLVLVGSVLLFTMKDRLQQKDTATLAVIKDNGHQITTADSHKMVADNGHQTAGAEHDEIAGVNEATVVKDRIAAVRAEKYAAGKNAVAARQYINVPSAQHKVSSVLSKGGADPSSVVKAADPFSGREYANIAPNRDTAGKSNSKETGVQVFAAVPGQPAAVKTPVRRDTIFKPAKARLNTSDFLVAESKNADKSLKKKEKGSKWDFGIQVTPAVTGSNLNFGAGLATAYRITEKFSLNSGISMLQMESARNITPVANNMASLRMIPDKQLLAVDANIKAIDIPLGLTYRVNKNFYTSAGVSFFSVISDQRSNTFTQTSQVSKMTQNPQTGFVATYNSLENTEVAEPTPDSPLKGNSYLGFFNFSIGRQQNIFNHYSIQIEPFIKVPIGKLSTEDLRLTNSGIKFQVSF